MSTFTFTDLRAGMALLHKASRRTMPLDEWLQSTGVIGSGIRLQNHADLLTLRDALAQGARVVVPPASWQGCSAAWLHHVMREPGTYRRGWWVLYLETPAETVDAPWLSVCTGCSALGVIPEAAFEREDLQCGACGMASPLWRPVTAPFHETLYRVPAVRVAKEEELL